MSMVSGGPRNEPRPPRRPSAGPRMESKQKPQARPQMPKQEAKPSQTKARIQDSRTIVPGGPGADTFQNDMMRNAVSFLNTPGRIVRGAAEGGIRAINPEFEMPEFEMPFMRGGAQGQGMPMPRNIDPGTDAILRAIMMRMQGGQ